MQEEFFARLFSGVTQGRDAFKCWRNQQQVKFLSTGPSSALVEDFIEPNLGAFGRLFENLRRGVKAAL